jgi:hypothetical protein
MVAGALPLLFSGLPVANPTHPPSEQPLFGTEATEPGGTRMPGPIVRWSRRWFRCSAIVEAILPGYGD